MEPRVNLPGLVADLEATLGGLKKHLHKAFPATIAKKQAPNMRGNPIGPGTRNISVNLPEAHVLELEALANESEMKFSGYVRAALRYAVDARLRFTLHSRSQPTGKRSSSGTGRRDEKKRHRSVTSGAKLNQTTHKR